LPIPDVWTVSPATIRNELAELVNMGYLEQPHTSAGRVPTPQGYRIYVNELMERQKLSLEESEEINRSLNEKLRQLDSAMTDIGKLASQLTDYPALRSRRPPRLPSSASTSYMWTPIHL
jgi:heat-inducible transcriptional repressor